MEENIYIHKKSRAPIRIFTSFHETIEYIPTRDLDKSLEYASLDIFENASKLLGKHVVTGASRWHREVACAICWRLEKSSELSGVHNSQGGLLKKVGSKITDPLPRRNSR